MRKFKSLTVQRMLWPLLALLTTALIWTVVLLRASEEDSRASQQARREAVSLVEAYEQYLTRSVGQRTRSPCSSSTAGSTATRRACWKA